MKFMAFLSALLLVALYPAVPCRRRVFQGLDIFHIFFPNLGNRRRIRTMKHISLGAVAGLHDKPKGDDHYYKNYFRGRYKYECPGEGDLKLKIW